MFDDLDDPSPPRAGEQHHAAAVARGRALRHRRQAQLVGGTASVVVLALVAVVALTSGKATDPQDVLGALNPGGSPQFTATPGGTPTGTRTSGPSPAVSAATVPVRPILGPQPARATVEKPTCTEAEEARINPDESTPRFPDGLRLHVETLPDADAQTISPGGVWTWQVSVTNVSEIPQSFTETGAPLLAIYAVGAGTGPADIVGTETDTNPATGEHELLPDETWSRVVRIPARGCASSGGVDLPIGGYLPRVFLQTDRGQWDAGGPPGWIVDPAGGACLDEPVLQQAPPVDGLSMTVEAVAPTAESRPRPTPDTDLIGRVVITNHTARALSVVEHDRRLTYLTSAGKLFGGWSETDGSPPAPVTTVVPARQSVTFDVPVPYQGCRRFQPQTPGSRHVTVGLLVERDGVRYHWVAGSHNAIRIYGGPGPQNS